MRHHDPNGAGSGRLCDQPSRCRTGYKLPCTAVHVIGQRPDGFDIAHTGYNVGAVKRPGHHSTRRIHIQKNAVNAGVTDCLLQASNDPVVTRHAGIRLKRTGFTDQRAGNRQNRDTICHLIAA